MSVRAAITQRQAVAARRRAAAGFTLIELCIVVVVLGILASFALPNYARARLRAMRGSCVTNQRNVITAATLYAAEHAIQNQVLNVQDLLTAGALPAGLTECPESGTDDNDDYVVTVTGGHVTAIECSVMGADHLFEF